ncbi:potassium transporter [Natronospirillum operosum]|uniref:Trk system potassium uptake protein n=1 Tax=Natronospirillum operosum TaxID=2759953 RepID=A0A4Z0W8R4_9GAMM|nr:TrkH family potassium uptake protein [Natronospirillum operosum]TGG91498.1 potassium transporter [Natronospirillum operosum]
MHFRIILRVLGLLLMVFSVAMLPPAGLSLWYDDGAFYSFAWSFVFILAAGLLLWLPVLRNRDELRTREGFLITGLFWVVLGTAGSLPLYLSTDAALSYTDAFFESFSGLTTTGATVMTGIQDLPESIRFYRQQLQWMGGMGIIVLAVAILPMLGVGGMQLYRAEMSGPMKDNKLAPRIAETAKALWLIYVGLTAAAGLGYWLAGMSPFDAVGHAFSTVAIGGFSTHDASIGHFNSGAIEFIAIVFMLLAAANFGLHFVAFRTRRPGQYLRDPEYRFFLLLIFGLMGVTTLSLWATTSETGWQALRIGAFEATSIMTTTGYASTGFAHFPLFLPFLLFMASFMGGSAGSTAGGMKSIRILLLWKQGVREVKRLIHPNGVFPIKVGRTEVPDRVLSAVWGYFSVYVFVFLVLLIAMLATGLDFVTSWSAVGAAMNNLGPGLGAVASNYASIPDASKWLLCFGMLMGRLEIFTLIIIMSPMFWRR